MASAVEPCDAKASVANLTSLARLALSTMYFQRWEDQTNLRPFLALGRELGFERFELGHGLSSQAVASLSAGSVLVQSVHHPCPRGSDPADEYGLVGSEPETRQRAARAVLRTLVTAEQHNAPAVLLHLGNLDPPQATELARVRFELESRYLAGQMRRPAYRAVRERLQRRLAELEPEHLALAAETLRPLVARASQAGIRLAIETAYRADTLPTPAGLRLLLDALPGDHFGAWLDTGHVMARQNLGLETFGDWFAAVGDRWVGVHFHDTVGLRDHLVPGDGQVPFAWIAEQLPPGVLRTCEFDWYFSPQEIQAGALELVRAGCS